MRSHALILTLFSCSLLLWPPRLAAQDKPFLASELIFPLEHWHNHSSSVVELPNGDLFVAWFHGSGERSSDDVVIRGARRNKKTGKWTAPFLLADSPGFPDTNCVLYLDSKDRLWLLWPVIIANRWESALMKYKVSSDHLQSDGPPNWDRSDNIILIPRHIAERTQAVFGRLVGEPGIGARASEQIAKANDKFFSRMGWFTRNHPVELASGRMLVPMCQGRDAPPHLQLLHQPPALRRCAQVDQARALQRGVDQAGRSMSDVEPLWRPPARGRTGPVY